MTYTLSAASASSVRIPVERDITGYTLSLSTSVSDSFSSPTNTTITPTRESSDLVFTLPALSSDVNYRILGTKSGKTYKLQEGVIYLRITPSAPIGGGGTGGTLADGAVTTAKLADGAVTSVKVTSIDASKIAGISTVGKTGSYNDLADKPASVTVADATTTAKGIVQLAGDLGGTAAAPTVPGLAGKASSTDSRFTDQRVPTDGSVTNAKVATNAAISADKTADGTTNKVYTATEKTKLAGVATGATANDTDANLKDRANHTGTQAPSTITGTAVITTDARLSDARTPTAHNHDDRYFTETESDGRYIRTVNSTPPDANGNVAIAAGGGTGGVTDHGALTGLADDDHPQYLNQTRADARYAQTSIATMWQSLPGRVVASGSITLLASDKGKTVSYDNETVAATFTLPSGAAEGDLYFVAQTWDGVLTVAKSADTTSLRTAAGVPTTWTFPGQGTVAFYRGGGGTPRWNIFGEPGVVSNNSVTSAKIVDGTIVNADISATAGIVGTKLANATVGGTQISTNTIANSHIFSAAAISADKLADGTTNKILTATERTKLAGIADSATVNSTDVALRDRTTHTGVQPIASVDGLTAALTGKVTGTGITNIVKVTAAEYAALAIKDANTLYVEVG